MPLALPMNLVTTRPKLAVRLVGWFAFLGPLGCLIPVPLAPDAFRFYYLLLLPSIVIMLWRGISIRTLNLLLILSPPFLYMAISSVNALVAGFCQLDNGQEGNPVIRLALLLVLLLFTTLAIDQMSTE